MHWRSAQQYRGYHGRHVTTVRRSPSNSRIQAGAAAAACLAFLHVADTQLLAQATQAADTLRPFTSDGCSAFPDGIPGNATLWQHCCVDHDLAYWKGGTRRERQAADATLSACVNHATKNPLLGSLMRFFVVLNAGPEQSRSIRWGYGWTHVRPYRALTSEELTRVGAVAVPDGIVPQVTHSAPRALPHPSASGDYCLDTAVEFLSAFRQDTKVLAATPVDGAGTLVMRTNLCRGEVRMRFAVQPHLCREPRYLATPLHVTPLQATSSGKDCAPLTTFVNARIDSQRRSTRAQRQ